MDGLALLCNLHADGPTTLRRLRESGVRDLEHIERLSTSILAGLLHASPSQARRLRHEASLLRERLGDVPLEPELPGRAPGIEPDPVPLRPAVEDTGPPPLVRRLVRPPQAFDLDPAGPSPALASSAPPSKPPASGPGGPTPLAPGLFEGLDARTCEALVREGVRTLETLDELAGLSLARRTGLPLPRLLDLRFRARSRLARSRTRPAGPQRPSAEMERRSAVPVVELIPAPRPVAAAPRSPARAPAVPSPRAPTLREEPGVAGPFV